MASNWNEYQEEAAAFFRSIGLDAETNVTMEGVRTRHAVDVVVRSHHVGFDVTWLVECKFWDTPVSKLHVLGLRTIVLELGADRGIVLSESGFQSGAHEAATLTNVHVTSLATLRTTATAEIYSMRMRDLYDRTKECRRRYWAISKTERIRLGLRPDVPDVGYSGDIVIQAAEALLAEALRGAYPFSVDTLPVCVVLGTPQTCASPDEVLALVTPMIEDLEKRLPKED